MLGWLITIYRQVDDSSHPARMDSPMGTRLAVWQAGVHGLRWIDRLVADGKVVRLGGNGYPFRYTARAGEVLTRVVEGPPHVHDQWVAGLDSSVLPEWLGKTTLDQPAIDSCDPDDWLLVEVWDES